MLTETIEREGNREDEENRNHIQLERDEPSADARDERKHPELKRNRDPALARDALAQLRLVRRVLFSSGAEVDREQRRREIERLEPARVAFWREVVTLRVLFVRSETGVMIEMPAGELRRGDAAGNRIDETEDAVDAIAGLTDDRAMHDLVKQNGAIEDGETGDHR